ncbi:terminase small subunit [Clostridium sp. D53t1_180928_C8]|uniref:terminase small subunit n=1 Tax=Clostridium sp. D53t1_180928_C8 TaxID=2787101 RepID=UPI0018AA000D|nr:terminase small subunit [Clostridium sp. D53t1_180928_C8]
MARKLNPKAKIAEKLYKKGCKLVDIANQIEVPASTVRRWKHQYDWDKKRSENKSERSDKKNNNKSNVNNKEVNDLVENEELTDKQKLFCIHYIKCFNATKAYQKVYKCKYETAAVNGSRLLKNTKIKKEIKELKGNKLNRAFISKEDIFQKYIDIAFSDITDFVDFGNKEVDRVYEDGSKVKTDITYTVARNADEIDGSLISEISNSESGVKVKLQDKMKALAWLSEHMDLATAEQKINIKKAEIDIELKKAEIESKGF